MRRGRKEKLRNQRHKWEDILLSQLVSLPLKHKSVKTAPLMLLRINREHAQAGTADTHKQFLTCALI